MCCIFISTKKTEKLLLNSKTLKHKTMINLTNKETAILFVMLFIVIAGITLTLFFNTFLFIGTSLIIAFIIAYNSDKKQNK